MYSTRIAAAVLVAVSLIGCGDETTIVDPAPNPVPVAESVSPGWAPVGSGPIEVAVLGSGFVTGSTVVFEGEERPTQVVSDTRLEATLLDDDVAMRREDLPRLIWVRNPPPGGGTSAALRFGLRPDRPDPVIYEIEPKKLPLGGDDTEVHVRGRGFVDSTVVRFEGFDVETAFVDDAHLTTVVPAAALVSGDTLVLQLHTPPPGGGTTGPCYLPVIEPRPMPRVTEVLPRLVPVAAPGVNSYTFWIQGTGFTPDAEVRFREGRVQVQYLSPEELRVDLPAWYFTDGGRVPLEVEVPGPGGGSSAPYLIEVTNPEPQLTGTLPHSIELGEFSYDIRLIGYGFVPSGVVSVGGTELATDFKSYTEVRVTVPAHLVDGLGSWEFELANPQPGGGTAALSLNTFSRWQIDLGANDIVHDTVRNRLAISVPSSNGAIGSAIAFLNPETAGWLGSIQLSSSPGTLALSGDGDLLYVSLPDEGLVACYDLRDDSFDSSFEVGTEPYYGQLVASKIVPSPLDARTVAISTVDQQSQDRFGGVCLYQDGVRLPDAIGRSSSADRIDFGDDGTFYAYSPGSYYETIYRVSVGPTGFTVEGQFNNVARSTGTNPDLEVTAGLMFLGTGQVIDVSTMTEIMELPPTGAFRVEPEADRIYFAGLSFSRPNLEVFDFRTGEHIGSVDTGSYPSRPTRILRTGPDELGFFWSGHLTAVRFHGFEVPASAP